MKIVNSILIIIIATTAFIYFFPPQIKVMASSDRYLNIQKITMEQGLSNNHINSILQDHYGYIWFGTLAGLNKYDGITFKIYYNNYLDVNSISNSDIQIIYESSNYDLWIGTAKGLNKFNRETDSFTTYLHDDNNPDSISHNRINAICEDKNGILWIGTRDGLNIFDQNTQNFRAYIIDPAKKNSLSDNNITSIYEDRNGILWIGTVKGLNKFNRETDSFTVYLHDANNPYSISSNRINAIYEDSNGTLWIGTAEGLNIFNRETNLFSVYMADSNKPQSLSSNFITSFCEDNNNDLWIGTRLGLNKLVSKEGTFQTYNNEVDNQNSISNNRIVTLYKDVQGILWIGTINGINKIDLRNSNFVYYSSILENNNVLDISSIDNKAIWLEIWGGIIKFDIENKAVQDKWNNIVYDQVFYSSMSNTSCIAADGCFWIGTGYSGLLRFNPITNQLKNYRSEPGNVNSLPSDSITSVYASHDGILWIGTTEGLCSLNISTEQFLHYQNNSGCSDALQNSHISVIYEDYNYNIWFGTDSGVYIFNKMNNEIKCAMNSSDYFSDSSDKAIYTIYEDSLGTIWIGTGFGLYRYKQDDGIISFSNNSLQNEIILCIIEDNYGDLWIATRQHGLGNLNIKDVIFKSYGVKDGLQDNFFSVGSCYKAENGELFFGTAGGLISFYPENITEDSTAPNVFINDFNLIDGRILFNKPVEDVREIELSYFDNSFEIDFIGLNYSYPQNNQYSYILEGFDNNWTYCSANESFTKYTNIPPGEYIFKVKASNSDGVWNEEGTSLKIIITPPFWQQWWFILSLILAAVLFIYLFIQFRTYTLQKYSQKLEHRFEEKTYQLVHKSEQLENELLKRAEFTRALAHELKTPLTPILSSSEFLMNTVENDITLGFINNIRQGILNLDKRINELMDMAKGEVGLIKLHCEYIFILNVIKDSIAYFIPEAQKKKQSLILDIPDILPKIYADEDRLKQVILNLLNNASKFTRKNGTITLKSKEENENIIVEVIDTGCGIDESELEHIFEPYSKLKLKKESLSGLGLGLYLAKLFIELHGGKIWVISTKGKGSTFAFSLPIQHNDDIK